MDKVKNAIRESMPEKKTFLGKLGKFMLYGGWMLVILLVLVLMMLFSHK